MTKTAGKKCQVTLNGEERLEYYNCGNKAVASIMDVVCNDRKPFYVCRKHKKKFLASNHYKLVKEC